jgi:hypothetical protein
MPQDQESVQGIRKRQQQESRNPGNLNDLFTVDLRNIISAAQDVRNIITTRQQEHAAEEDYCLSNYQVWQNYSGSTRKCKPDILVTAREHPQQGRKLGNAQEHFEKLLHKYFPWHPTSKHSAIKCYKL